MDTTALRHRLLDRAIELRVEPGRVAVLGHGAVPSRPADVAVDADAPALPPRWAVWTVAGDATEAARSLVGRSDIAFATPILRCDDGHWRIPTPEILIRTRGRLDDGALATLMADHGIEASSLLARDEWALDGLLRLRSHSSVGLDTVRLADRIADDPRVLFAEPDFLMGAVPASLVFPTDPFFGSQWALHDIGQSTACGGASFVNDIDVNAPQAWALVQGSADVLVLVIDDGIQFDHPDLLGDPALGFDPTPAAGGGWPVHPCDRHGTAVVGVLAARASNGTGIAGLAHGVRFASARVALANDACLSWTFQPSWVAAALEWGESIGATISNTSWGFTPSGTIASAYADRAAKGMVHFAASGNQLAASVVFPANLPTVVAVGALARGGTLALFSNFGVDQELVAPGVQIITTDRTGDDGFVAGDYVCLQGTSYASPLAAATAALMLSANPSLTAAQVRSILQSTTTDLGPPGWDPTYGHGLIRADAAIAAAIDLLDRPGDLNGDGAVDGADLGILLNLWGSGDPLADLNGDGIVDGADLGILLNHWGR